MYHQCILVLVLFIVTVTFDLLRSEFTSSGQPMVQQIKISQESSLFATFCFFFLLHRLTFMLTYTVVYLQ